MAWLRTVHMERGSEDTVNSEGCEGGSQEAVMFWFIRKDEFYSLEGGEECVVQPWGQISQFIN